MARNHEVVAAEIIETIEANQIAIRERSYDDYANGWLIRRAIERGLEIISEASRHLPAQWTEKHPEVPWPKVRALGNVPRHEYHNIVDRVLWTICIDDLPAIKTAVIEMIESSWRSSH